MCFSAAATSFASLVYLKKHASTLPFWSHITLRAWLFYHGRARWRSRHSRCTPVPSNFKQSRQISIWYNADGAACNSKGKSGSSHWSLNEGCLYNSMAAVCCQSHCVTDRFRQSAGRLSPVCSHTHVNKSALFFFFSFFFGTLHILLDKHCQISHLPSGSCQWIWYWLAAIESRAEGVRPASQPNRKEARHMWLGFGAVHRGGEKTLDPPCICDTPD